MRYKFIDQNTEPELVNHIEVDGNTISNLTDEMDTTIDKLGLGKPLVEEIEPVDVEKYHFIYEENDTQIIKKWVLSTKYEPTKEEIMSSKIIELENARETTIANGFNCDALGTGNLHYALTKTEQSDLALQYEAIKGGATQILWHDTSKYMHETYTAEQFKIVFANAYIHTLGCKMRCDGLKAYVSQLLTDGKVADAQAVNWATTIPTEIQNQLNTQTHIQPVNAGIINETTT